MTERTQPNRPLLRDYLNFLVTNCLPRRWATRLVRRVSRSEDMVVRAFAMAVWRTFCDVDLSDARVRRFKSMHDCFTRQLRDGARTIDPNPSILTSPSDGIVGACGDIRTGTLLQAKGMHYALRELLGDDSLAARFTGGSYVTLRLTAGMYHRFHAPHDCRVEQVRYLPGELWNVNPPTLQRIDQLFCRNERAVLLARLNRSQQVLAMVPVAAILVGGIRLHCVDLTLSESYSGPSTLHCAAALHKGQEMGWFEHGSTIIVLAPAGIRLAPGVATGVLIRVGQPLLIE